MSGGSVRTIKKNTEAFWVANKQIGPIANAEEIKHMVTSRDQNTGQNHNIRISNKSFESVKQLKYLVITLKIKIHS